MDSALLISTALVIFVIALLILIVVNNSDNSPPTPVIEYFLNLTTTDSSVLPRYPILSKTQVENLQNETGLSSQIREFILNFNFIPNNPDANFNKFTGTVYFMIDRFDESILLNLTGASLNGVGGNINIISDGQYSVTFENFDKADNYIFIVTGASVDVNRYTFKKVGMEATNFS
jgi:hypothetical protein